MRAWTQRIRSGKIFDADEVRVVVAALLSSKRSDEDAADFLQELHRRGETFGEVAAFADCLLEQAEPFSAPSGLGPLMDVCGTGGDRLGLFNVSTAVMFVAAGAGARVVKHGNRRITSQSGGADVLEELGVPVEMEMEGLRGMLEEAGATFLFAPRFHPSFKSLAGVRQMLAARGSASIFNMLGPLLNPARPSCQLVGVFSEKLLEIYSGALPLLGRERLWAVHGVADQDGFMDEISTCGPTEVREVFGKAVSRRTLSPDSMGVASAKIEDLLGGSAANSARILHEILSGGGSPAARDMVLVNAAAALFVAGVAADWDEGMARAAESLDSGAAHGVLKTMRRVSGRR